MLIGQWESGLRVKFSVGLRPGTDFFFPIPRTLEAAESEGWSAVARPTGPLPSLTMYCPDDRVVCALFDDDGNVAGLQISMSKDDISGSALDWITQGFTEWTATTAAGETKEFWSIQQYFVSDATLNMSKEDRIRAFERSLMREGAVWVSGFNGELMKISNKADDIADSVFTRQACIPWMGRHYYYNMTSETTCTADTLLPWFPIVHSDELIAMGLIMHGQNSAKDGGRDWYERPSKIAVQAIVPDGPECLYNMASTPGIVTMHIYYVEKPWFIGCLTN
ncbi:unnamed protein product, partial [Iphiclides podalirius]